MATPIQIEITAELRSGLHILGPGRVGVLLDRPIELDLEGYPIIPASSLRGRLRVHLERLLAAWGLPVCAPPAPARMCPHAWHDQSAPPDGYCLACRIFGSAWYPSPLLSADLRLNPKQRGGGPELLRDERMSVAISRRLGTAQSERLFSTETTVARFGHEPLQFQGTLNGRLSEIEAGWLLAAVGTVTHLGGNKARGLGALQLSATAVRWRRDKAWADADVAQLIEGALNHAAA
jgi:CRISPR/Cas system CSM-associated protein Csm3 (group 7 of RAMP superfamily)